MTIQRVKEGRPLPETVQMLRQTIGVYDTDAKKTDPDDRKLLYPTTYYVC